MMTTRRAPAPIRIVVALWLLGATTALAACGDDQGDDAAEVSAEREAPTAEEDTTRARPDPRAFIEAILRLPYWGTTDMGPVRDLEMLAADASGVVVGTIQDVVAGPDREMTVGDLVSPEARTSLPAPDRPLVESSADVIIRVDDVVGSLAGGPDRVALAITMAQRPPGMGGPGTEELLRTLTTTAPIGGQVTVFVRDQGTSDEVAAANLPRLDYVGLDGVLFEDPRGRITGIVGPAGTGVTERLYGEGLFDELPQTVSGLLGS